MWTGIATHHALGLRCSNAAALPAASWFWPGTRCPSTSTATFRSCVRTVTCPTPTSRLKWWVGPNIRSGSAALKTLSGLVWPLGKEPGPQPECFFSPSADVYCEMLVYFWLLLWKVSKGLILKSTNFIEAFWRLLMYFIVKSWSVTTLTLKSAAFNWLFLILESNYLPLTLKCLCRIWALPPAPSDRPASSWSNRTWTTRRPTMSVWMRCLTCPNRSEPIRTQLIWTQPIRTQRHTLNLKAQYALISPRISCFSAALAVFTRFQCLC